jgi:hypothetical protein
MGPLLNGPLGVNAHVVDPASGAPPPANVVMTAPEHTFGDGDGDDERETLGDGESDSDTLAGVIASPGDAQTEDDADVDGLEENVPDRDEDGENCAL